MGNFLDYNSWKNGIEILEMQLEDKKKGIKFYRTLQLEILEKIEKKTIKEIKSEEYYKEFIENKLFYGLEEQFYQYYYPRPKSYFEIRTLTFFSFQMLAVHNMISFYLLKLTEVYINDYKKYEKNIKSFYGGNLKIKKSGKDVSLNISTYDLYYFNFYKKFKNTIKRKCKIKNNSMILKLDIKNYYESISIKKLLENIEKYTSNQIKIELNYNKETIESIIYYYTYISKNLKDNIPTHDNGIASDFIGYLYLFFIEKELKKELLKKYEGVKLEIMRYVDDMFIEIKFEKELKNELTEESLKILGFISEFLYNKYELHLNSKVKLYNCSEENEIEQLKKDLALLSREDLEIEAETDNPVENLNEIYKEIEKIKNQGIKVFNIFQSRNSLGNIDLEILKDIYDKKITSILKKESERVKFRELLNDFPTKLIKVAPKPFLVILNAIEYEDKINQIKRSLMETKELNITDLNLMLEILGQEEYKDTNLLKKLEENYYLKNIIKSIMKSENNEFIYLNVKIRNEEILKVFKNTEELIYQIVKRRFSEKSKNFSLALNHLVNEIQLFSFKFLDKDRKTNYENYTAKEIERELKTLEVDFDIIKEIRNMFEIRNINQISHSVSDVKYIKVVEQEEYNKMLEIYGELLKELSENKKLEEL